MKVLHHYNQDHNTTSATEMVPYIIKLVQPKSVVDVGCGLGQWLEVFADHGVKTTLGIDGSHVLKEKMRIPRENFLFGDLCNAKDISVNGSYDLVISLEVGEHLDKNCADQYVRFLTSLGSVILFSAAIPFQTGENHINEQYPEYWQEKFGNYDFVYLDPFRVKFWNNDSINWWYRQNMFLVVHKKLVSKYPYPYNENFYIHPKLYELHAPTSRFLESSLKS